MDKTGATIGSNFFAVLNPNVNIAFTNEFGFAIVADCIGNPNVVATESGIYNTGCDMYRNDILIGNNRYTNQGTLASPGWVLIGSGGGGGVATVTDNGNMVVTVNNTDPLNPVIDFNGVFVDGVTITGNGQSGNPLIAISGVPILTATQVAFGDSSNLMTSSSGFTYVNGTLTLLSSGYAGELNFGNAGVLRNDGFGNIVLDNTGHGQELAFVSSGGVNIQDSTGSGHGISIGGGNTNILGDLHIVDYIRDGSNVNSLDTNNRQAFAPTTETVLDYSDINNIRFGNITNAHDMVVDSSTGTVTINSYGVAQFQASDNTGIVQVGDVGYDWYKNILSINSPNRLITLQDAGSNYLSIDNVYRQYGFGDLGSVVNGTRIIIDDISQLISFNGSYSFPFYDGTVGQTLVTNGLGIISWGNPSATAVAIGTPITSGLPNSALFIDIAGNLANSADYSYDTSASDFKVGFGGHTFLDIGAGGGTYQMGDINFTNNGTYLTINDGGKDVTINSSGAVSGLSLNFTTRLFDFGEMPTSNYFHVDGTTDTLSLISSGSTQLSASSLTGIQQFGDLGFAFFGDNLKIDGIARTITFNDSLASRYFSLDMAAHIYEMGDIDHNGNSTVLTVDDATSTISSNAYFTAPQVQTGVVFDTTPIPAIDINNRLFYDLASTVALDLNTRVGYGTDGVSSLFDWNSTSLFKITAPNLEVDAQTTSFKDPSPVIAIQKGGTFNTATLGVGGTITITTPNITANSQIFLTVPSGITAIIGTLTETARVPSTSFTITSNNPADRRKFGWWLVEQIP